ncbi:MAG: hypothetical protein ACQCN4_10005, partial [Candidatus Bathyarchaeia archaeon]
VKKLFLRQIIHGWLPKEQPFHGVHEAKKSTQISQSANQIEEARPLTKREIRALTTLGIANLIMLIGYSSYFVFYMVTPSFQNTTLGLGLWAFVLFSFLSVNCLLYWNYRKQAKLAEAGFDSAAESRQRLVS